MTHSLRQPSTGQNEDTEELQVHLLHPLNQDFNLKGLEGEFLYTSAEQRIQLAHNWFREQSDKQIVLTSSFGPQSLLMLHYAKASGLDIPVVSVDIPGPKYDLQREYRQALQREMRLDVTVFHAKNEADKVRAMNEGLRGIGAGVLLTGIRAAQTENRAQRSPVMWNARSGMMEISPILDWHDAKAAHYLEQMPQKLWHPQYSPSIKAQGGAILAADEPKTECGLWA